MWGSDAHLMPVLCAQLCKAKWTRRPAKERILFPLVCSKQRLERIVSRCKHRSATHQKTTTATDVHRRVEVAVKVRVASPALAKRPHLQPGQKTKLMSMFLSSQLTLVKLRLQLQPLLPTSAQVCMITRLTCASAQMASLRGHSFRCHNHQEPLRQFTHQSNVERRLLIFERAAVR